MAVFPLDPQAIAKEIEIPLERWPGNCHGIAEEILRKMPIEGMRLTRGHFDGHVSRDSIYRGGAQQHSWLTLADGRILDPTRWAMESPHRPFIYLGESDHYDEAGLVLRARGRAAFAGSLAAIGRERPGAVLARKLNASDRSFVEDLFAAADIPLGDEIRPSDVDHLLSDLADPVEYHEDPERLYRAARAAGLGAMIPADLQMRVLDPEQVMPARGVNFFYDAPPGEDLSEMQALFRVFARFLSIEERGDRFERELEELGYGLEEFWNALNEMERCLKVDPDLSWMPSEARNTIAIVGGDYLGAGFGQELRVERYAASLGLDRAALHRAIVRFAEPAGYDFGWLIGREAERAMAEGNQEPVPEL